MELNRRDFLRITLVTAAAASMPALASISPLPESNPNDYLQEAIRLYDEVIAAVRNRRRYYEITGKNNPSMNDAIDKATDALFTHVFKTFQYQEDEETFNAVQVILDDKDGDALEAKIRKIPPVILESAWPVAAMKTLLRKHEAPINHRRINTFGTFVSRYGEMILADRWESLLYQRQRRAENFAAKV